MSTCCILATSRGRQDSFKGFGDGQFADLFKSDFEPVHNMHNMYWEENPEHVRRLDENQAFAKVFVFVMRWWTSWNAKNRRSRSHIVAIEQMILAVLEEIGTKHGVLDLGHVVALEFPRVFNESCDVRSDFLKRGTSISR